MYSYRTFTDIPVVPFSDLLGGPLGGAEHAGGPIWPDWDNRTFERHCRDRQPIDQKPSLDHDLVPVSIDHAFWGGPIANHFGHQIADFSMRILPSRFVDPAAKLVFFANLFEPPQWFHEILRWADVGANDVFFAKQAHQFDALSVCEQPEQLWATQPSNDHLDLMDRFIQNKQLDLKRMSQPIYVSRAGLNVISAGFAGERYLEHCINQSGGYVFRPELNPLEDQLKLYLRSGELIFAEGSAIHACQLLGRFPANVDVLSRNEHFNIISPNISNRVNNYRNIHAVKHVICGLTLSGKENVWNTVSIFDLEKLHDYFKSKGLDISKCWNMDAYIDEVIKDVLSWVNYHTGNRPRNSLENDLAVIKCLKRAHLDSIAHHIEEKIRHELKVSIYSPIAPAQNKVTTDEAIVSHDGQRFLLCIPHGGLNDTLCQIEACWRYAKKFNRTLVIDTRQSGLLGEFAHFFSLKQPNDRVLEALGSELMERLNQLTCFPDALAGHIGCYTTGYSKELRQRYHVGSDQILSFDFSLDYSQALLVHEQAGGGSLANDFVHHIQLSPRLNAEIRLSLGRLSNEYVGVHVRNTDLHTDYKQFFSSIYERVLGKTVLLCSDDVNVIEYGRKFFDHSKVVSLSNIPNLNSSPLHLYSYGDEQSRTQATTDAIRDLVLLGNASELYTTETEHGFISGYGRLASYLFNNKSIINDWLDHAVQSFIKEFLSHYVSVDLIRVGGEGDGGYLIPDVRNSVSHCFSPGVDYVASFEDALSQSHGIKSFMADASVAAPPLENKDFNFVRKFLGAESKGDFITLSDWMGVSLIGDERGLLLQMDIEGGEYDVLSYESSDTLARFSVMVIEFHGWQSIFDEQFLGRLTEIFNKIYQNFSICHVHPNNCCGIAEENGISVPRVLEITFIRNDLIDKFATDPAVKLPHKLDFRNLKDQADIQMPEAWWKKSRNQTSSN